uniref:Vacuolar protein sorting-associated protein 53 homolog n=1 Tax=Macrostomum lignano TaxID=282301 RepID=A0A1I8G7X4_9PLAT
MSHLERLIDRLFYTQQSGGHKRRTLSEVSANFPTFASAAVAMMREDFDLIRADYFPTIGNSQDSVINIYLDYVCQELADFAHTLERTLTESSAKQSGGARGGGGGTVHFFSNLANDALSLETLLQGILVVSHDESSVVLETSSQLQPLLQWQAELEPYFPVLARSLEHQLHQSWQRTYSDRIRCSVDESVRQGRLDFPQLIHKSLQDYTQLVQRLMRLAVFCTDGGGSSGLLLLKSLVATVQLHFHAMVSAHSALLDGSGGGDGGGGGGGSPAPADGIPDAEFPIRIGDAAYAMHVCGHLAQSLAGCHAESSSAMYALHKTFSALLHRLTGEAELRYSQNFLTCLLFDAGSNYWEDGQEFHDETRVSFSVERWYLELRRIWHSLSSTCPHEISRCVLLSLLEKTLGFLLQRYAQATPSHRRVNQYRADITAILMMTEDLLYAVCEHAEQVTNPDQLEDASIYFVHNCCSGLLACLAVVSSPLADLHRAFRKGLGAADGKSSSSKSSDRQTAAGGESVSGSCTYWLSVVRPEMYLPDAVTLDAMPCQVALLMQLRLLQESPAARHEHVLAALLMKQFALSVQLVSRACLSASGSDSGCEATLACLLTVLSHCRGAQLEGPLRCLLPVLDRGGGGGGGGPDDEGQWEHLDRRRFLGLAKASDAPLWLRALGRLLEPHLETALRAAVSEAAQRKAAELQVPSRSVCPALHGPLPCGCAAPVPASRSSAAAAGSSAAAAADSLLVALAAEWPRTPPAVQFCLRALGDTAARRGARPIGDCAGLHILGACMAQHLRRLRLKDSASDLGLGADPDAVLQRLVEALTDEVRRPASVLRIVEAVSSQSASSMLAPFIETVSPGPPSAPSGGSGGQSGVSAAWQDRRQLAAMLAEVDAAGHLPHLVGLGHLLRRNAECLAAGLGVAAADDDEVAAAAASAGF